MALLSDILTWWSGSRVPTVPQRRATFNSFRHKSDNVLMSEVTGLNDALNGKANSTDFNNLKPIVLAAGIGSYDVKSGTLIRSFCVIDDAELSFSVGLTPEGKEYIEDAEVSVGSEILDVPKYFRADTTIYFSGITSETIIRITKG